MNVIGTSTSGGLLIELTPQEVDGLALLSKNLAELAALRPAIARPTVERDTRPTDVAVHRAERKPKQHEAPKGAKPDYPSRAKLRAVTNAKRNKKCDGCGVSFYDESRTNVRKFCGPGGCRRGAGGQIRSSDLPKDGHGRTVPLSDPAAESGAGD